MILDYLAIIKIQYICKCPSDDQSGGKKDSMSWQLNVRSCYSNLRVLSKCCPLSVSSWIWPKTSESGLVQREWAAGYFWQRWEKKNGDYQQASVNNMLQNGARFHSSFLFLYIYFPIFIFFSESPWETGIRPFSYFRFYVRIYACPSRLHSTK